MPKPLGGGRPVVPPQDTALHAWLAALIKGRMSELGWRQIDLRRASGCGCSSVSQSLRGITGGTLATWQKLITASGATLPEVDGSQTNDLRAFLAATVKGSGVTVRELARRADVNEHTIYRMLVGHTWGGTYSGTLMAWQRLLDAAGVTLPEPAQATRR